MRNQAVERLTGALSMGALLFGASGLLGGCGPLGGDNTDQVCADTKKVFEQYVTRVRTVSAAKPEQWKQPTEQLAGQVDGLSAKAENAKLKKALKDEAGRLRAAAAEIADGDAARLNNVMTATPQQIGQACS